MNEEDLITQETVSDDEALMILYKMAKQNVLRKRLEKQYGN